MVTERRYGGEFLLSEAPGARSRENITIDESMTLLAGRVLGKKTLGAVTVAAPVAAGSGAAFANTGDGTFAATPTADAGAPAGTWRLVVIEPAANAGKFILYKPDGSIDGQGTVAVAYNGGLNFTLQDGAADFIAGDGFSIGVSYAAGSGRYVALDPAATDGSQIAAGILWDDVTTGAGVTAAALGIVRDAEVDNSLLGWGALSAPQIAQAKVELGAAGVVFR